ncbi:MAG TPA: hypothetical protein VFV87_20005 [Pirellulaceae bacterium]|nr:hypothetical protein [Pirellulaceae bacterium]
MFRFTIRDVLWLTTLAAILVMWWMDHRRLDQAGDEARAAAKVSEERVHMALKEINFLEKIMPIIDR